MKRYIRSSATSSKTVNDSNVKASTDNYNPYSFMVGDQLEWSGLYGGEYKGVVTNVTDEYITVDVMWIAEDSGKLVTDTRRFEIATDPEGRECIIVYRYRDTVGYVYPPSNEYINSAEEYFDKVYSKCISEANQDINTIRRMYANNEGAPSTILLNLGYTEDESGEAFTKSMHTAGHIYETVFNFAKYDWEDGPVLMYVLRDGEVPKGWTVTKFDLYDEEGNVISSAIDPYSEEDDPAEFNSINVKSSRKIHASWNYYPYALYSYTPGDSETGIEGDKFDIIDVVKSADIDEAKRYFKNKRILWYPNSFVDRISDEDYNAFLKEQEELARYESAVKSHNGSADEVINSSYSPDLLNDLVNYYRLFDTMSSEEIWDEIVAEYNNEDLANDVLESLDHEEDVDLADEEGAYDVYSSSDIKASMGRYDEYFGKTAAATYGDLIADRLRGKSVSKRRDTANEPGGLIYEANKLGIDMWDLLEALEGMCNEGRAREIDDSTYEILGSSNINASTYDEKQFAIEELSLSGEVSLGNCSKSTLYRWRNEINDRLQISKCDWRVKANPKDNSLVAVPLDELNSNCDVYSSEDFEDNEDDLDHPYQEFDSAKTSINSKKLPAVYRMIHLQPGTVGVDFGGGRWDSAVEYLRDQDVTLCVYDPYNRSAEHNKEVLRTLRANGGADFAINSNVLNVIKEPEARKGVLENIKKITKPGAPIYITVYEGRGDAKEGVTKSGYQLNRKTADYLEEIQEVFPNATRKGKLITATNSGSTKHIKSSRNATFRNDKRLSPTSERYKGYLIVLDRGGDGYNVYDKHRELEDAGYPSIDAAKKFIDELVANDDVYSAHSAEKVDWYELDWDEQIQLMKKYVRQYKGSRIFEDFAEYIDEPVEDIIDAFSDAEFRGDLRIPERMQLDSEYRNDDIYSTSQITRSVECAANIDDPNNNGWVKRWDFLDNYYKGNLVISKISSPVDGWHIEKVAPNGHTIKHLGNYKSLESAMEAADKHLCNHCGSHSYDENGNVVEASQSYLDRIEELMEQGLDEDTASREAYAEFYPDEYDADDYDEIYSATTSSSRYWYFTRHGVQPGSVPKYINILDIVDTPEGSYFLADGVILTDDLRNYEIKERKPKNDVVEASKSTKGETVEAGYYDIPEPPIDPPEDDSWTEVDGWIEDVDLDVDAIIEVLDDGSWIYEDETYPWAVSKDSYNGDHYSYEYYVHIGDPGTIVEDFDDVIEKYIPSEEGRYHLKCKATLKYFIEGVEVKQSDYHDEEVYKDNASVEFDEYNSKVENVSVERIW